MGFLSKRAAAVVVGNDQHLELRIAFYWCRDIGTYDDCGNRPRPGTHRCRLPVHTIDTKVNCCFHDSKVTSERFKRPTETIHPALKHCNKVFPCTEDIAGDHS